MSRPGGQVTTGTIQPGVIYMADTWQIAVEALIPVNAASGHNVGAIAELHFFLDDIFPIPSENPCSNEVDMFRNLTVKIIASLAFAAAHRRHSLMRNSRRRRPPSAARSHASPTEIRLKFSEGVEPRFSSIALATEAGAAETLGKASVDSADSSHSSSRQSRSRSSRASTK